MKACCTQAARLGEVPVGAVLVARGRVVSRAHNLVEARKDPTAHAELLAIQQVQSYLLVSLHVPSMSHAIDRPFYYCLARITAGQLRNPA